MTQSTAINVITGNNKSEYDDVQSGLSFQLVFVLLPYMLLLMDPSWGP